MHILSKVIVSYEYFDYQDRVKRECIYREKVKSEIIENNQRVFLRDYLVLKSRGPILRVTSSETRSVCVKQPLILNADWSMRWSGDTFLIKLRL